MDKTNQESFFCFNCGAKNYFEKGKYATENKADNMQTEGETPVKEIKEVSVECKSCREINVVRMRLFL